ncbi:protein of unknown function [Microbacterium sp. Nx66]|nr:protein of unknown function [Microbacterium sp. Nx66]
MRRRLRLPRHEPVHRLHGRQRQGTHHSPCARVDRLSGCHRCGPATHLATLTHTSFARTELHEKGATMFVGQKHSPRHYPGHCHPAVCGSGLGVVGRHVPWRSLQMRDVPRTWWGVITERGRERALTIAMGLLIAAATVLSVLYPPYRTMVVRDHRADRCRVVPAHDEALANSKGDEWPESRWCVTCDRSSRSSSSIRRGSQRSRTPAAISSRPCAYGAGSSRCSQARTLCRSSLRRSKRLRRRAPPCGTSR